MSAQRRTELHRMLKARRRVVAAHLAIAWERSEKTIRRDLEAMRDDLRLPIRYDPRDQTWRYTGEVAELEPMLVSGEDRRALLFSLAAAAQLEGTPVCGQIERLYRTMLSTLPPERATRFDQMIQCIRFTGPRTKQVPQPVWQVLLLCLEAGETVQITYTDGVYGSTTDRAVDPYGLIMSDRHWVLIAQCHRGNKVTPFSLARISTAQSTDRTFQVPAGFMDEYLKGAVKGYQSEGDKQVVKLRIHPDAPLYVRERIWNDEETRRVEPDQSIIVTFPATALFMVEREVRAEGSWVELLEPAESRKSLHREAQLMAKSHRRRARR